MLSSVDLRLRAYCGTWDGIEFWMVLILRYSRRMTIVEGLNE